MRSTLNIAIPKGRLTKNIFSHFQQCGIEVPEHNRQLIISVPSARINILLVKNTDLSAYVANGIACMGIVGSDILEESKIFFYSLGIFHFGKTNMCLISKKNTPHIEESTQATIATKYIHFTEKFLSKRGINAHIIPLHGSVELAPLLGLSQYIVDIVETGQTIKENGLVIQEELERISVQLIANPAQYKYFNKDIDAFMRTLKL